MQNDLFIIHCFATKACAATGGRIVFNAKTARRFSTQKAAETALRKLIRQDTLLFGSVDLPFEVTQIKNTLYA